MRTSHQRLANVILLTSLRVSRSGLDLYTSRPSATMRGGRCPGPCAARWPTWRDFEMSWRKAARSSGRSFQRPTTISALLVSVYAAAKLSMPICIFLTGKPCGRSRGVVLLFAGLDVRRQAVLRRRQRAGGERREGAGGAIGLIEVEDHGAVPRRRRIEEPAGRVGLGSIGLVGEDEKQLLVARLLDHRPQPEFLSLEREAGVPGAGELLGCPENVRDCDREALVVRLPFGHTL